MVFVKRPTFKTGINPSMLTTIDMKNLTPTQKMILARNRIWGNIIGGTQRSGYRELKRGWPAARRAKYY